MSLFSHRAHTHAKPHAKTSASLPIASPHWQKSTSKGLSTNPRRAAIPPWLINTGSLIIMGFLVLLSLSIGVADFSWSGILQSLISHSANS
ncbi:MAG: ABC transporter permease, partial [Psychrobacter sp.]|nr:ABC transporter permease [Psychrobacter sp.]